MINGNCLLVVVLNLWRMLEGDEMEIVCWWWC